MTLKALKQLTNIGWIIGVVSAVSGGYSYINSKKDRKILIYKPKVIDKISSIEDIEDFQTQKGCLFVYYTKKQEQGRDEKPLTLNYNEWINGGVLTAREYVNRDENKKEEIKKDLIEKTEKVKDKCKHGEIIYGEIDTNTNNET